MQVNISANDQATELQKKIEPLRDTVEDAKAEAADHTESYDAMYRAKAKENSQVIGTLNHGDKEKISADKNGWLRFSLTDGRIGYVSDEYMAVVDQ